MQVRDHCEQVEGILFLDGPSDLWGMRGDVAEGSKYALHKIGEALLLRLLSLRSQAVYGEQWVSDRKRLIHQFRAIGLKPCLLPDLIRYALGCLEDCVKIVLLKKLSPANLLEQAFAE